MGSRVLMGPMRDVETCLSESNEKHGLLRVWGNRHSESKSRLM